jgi:hypothetical protein
MMSWFFSDDQFDFIELYGIIPPVIQPSGRARDSWAAICSGHFQLAAILQVGGHAGGGKLWQADARG